MKSTLTLRSSIQNKTRSLLTRTRSLLPPQRGCRAGGPGRLPVLTRRLFLLTVASFVAVAALLGMASSANKANRVAKAREAQAAGSKSAIIKNSIVAKTDQSPDAVTVRAAKRGNPRMNLQDGRSVEGNYKNATTQAVSNSLSGARPLSLASGDLNVDGYPDLVAGYASETGSFVTLRLGNPEAFSPTKPETIEAIKNGQFHDSFLPNAALLPVPEAPEFLAVGDFDRDGRLDILTATRGNDTMYLALGDEAGFSVPQALHLPGAVTALVTGQTDNALAEVAVGIQSYAGSQVLVYAAKQSVLTATPVAYSLPATATAIALGQMDEGSPMDLAVAAGNEVVILHDAGQPAPDQKSAATFHQSQIEHIAFSSVVTSVAVGDFISDRQGRPELAALGNDGTIHILTHGELDTRPLSEAEVFARRQRLEEMRERRDFGSVAPRPWRQGAPQSEAQAWSEVKSFNAGAPDAGASQRLLTSAKLATGTGEQLLMLDTANNQLRVVMNEQAAQTAAQAAEGASTKPNLVSIALDVEGAPVAALSMRLSVMALPGLVVLSSNQPAPVVLPNAPLVGFVVTKTADTNDGACNADCSLREAVVAANANGVGADIITFNAGINPTLTLTSGGAPENSAASGDLDINSSVTITGNTPTVISTTYTATCGDCKVFGVDQTGFFPGLAVSFSGVTVQGGFNTGAAVCGTFFETGGGIDFFLQNTGNIFSMATSTVQNNTATGCAASHGGGVNVDSVNTQTVAGPSAGTVTFTSVTFTKNTSLREGGGVSLHADKHDVTMTNCIVGGPLPADGNQTTDTTTTSAGGGGVNLAHSWGGTGTINGASSSIRNNSAIAGGGLVIGFNTNALISNVNISDNTSTGAGAGHSSAGGGVIIVESGVDTFTATISLTDCTISTNHADNNNAAPQGPLGGGVYFSSAYGATLSNCTISGNTAGGGAGVYDGGSGASPAAILTINSGSTIFGNTAASVGGGVFGANTTGSHVVLNGITIDSNAAPAGDGIEQQGGAIDCQGTINVNGGDSMRITGGTFTSTSGTFNLTGNFTNSGGTFTHNSGTFVFNGTGAQSLGGTTSSTFNNLTVNKGSGTLTLGVNTPVAGNLTVTAGTFDLGAFTANRTAPGGTLTVSPGATLKIGGTNSMPTNFSTYSLGTTSPFGTVEYNGTGSQTINALNYGNLTSSSSGARTLASSGTIGVAGTFTPGTNAYTVTGSTVDFNGSGSQTIPVFNFNNLTSSNSGARTLASSGTIGVAGVFTPGGNLYTVTGSTIDFNGSGSQTIPAFNYNNLTSSNVGGRTLASSGTIGVAGAFTPGANAYTVTGSTVDFNGTGTQSVPAFSYNNLTISGARGGATVTLASGTINVAGAFSPTATAVVYSTAGNTIVFNGAGSQTIPAFTFNNLSTATGGTKTLGGNIVVSGGLTIGTGSTLDVSASNFAINVGGDWTNNGGTFTPGAGTVTFNGSGAQNLNGSAATQTFNNFTVNKGGGTLTGGGSTTTLTLNGNFAITAGTFAAGTITTMNVAGNWANGGTFTAGGSTVVFNGNNSTQTLTGTTTFNNLTSNHTGTGSVTAAGSSLTVTGLLRIQAGTFTSSSTLTNVQIDSGATLASDGSTMNVSGNWTNNGGTFTPNGNTVNFNGGAAQAINGTAASQTFNNFTVNKGGGALSAGGSTTSITTNNLTMTLGTFTAPATLDINGNNLLTAGTLTAGANITAAGNWTNNAGTFAAGSGTVTFDGTGAQTINTTSAFDNLTINNTGGSVTLASVAVVNLVLNLMSDLDTGSFKLIMPDTGSSTGTADVVGNVERVGVTAGGGANNLSYGNPFNTIKVTNGVAPGSITVNLVKSAPATYLGAVQRTYTITLNAGGPITQATLRLHYLDSELNSNAEPSLNLRRFRTGDSHWVAQVPGTVDQVNNFVESATVAGADLTTQWTFSSLGPTASSGVVTGRIADSNGAPVEGAVVRLSGTQNRKFITDANGFYRFDNVETNGFYTVTPARVNYAFSPSSRSFSLIGETTEAAFGASLTSSTFVNPLDTPEYFVRQHYIDFLGREPDEAGFNFWSDQILECANDNACIERRRENVSAAYFLSIEFQQTGGLVDGLYRASYGRQSQYSEFMPDTRAVGLGVVVGTEGWQARLQANKEAFVNAFVNRPTFVGVYGNMNNSLFVDTLLGHTGVTFAASERDALTSGLAAGTMTRADVVRSIAENNRFVNAKLNEAFVMMEYFGYLRRNADPSGYAFWLNKLNEFNGNFERAEMVKAFIVSGEYRDRFPW